MKLIVWMKQCRGRRAELAAKVKLSPQHLDYVARQKKRATPQAAAAISAATGGEVSVAEILYPEGLPAGARMEPDASSAARVA
jgi:DNA-binding transcriptional regulator YdaS (Cro superfamily)